MKKGRMLWSEQVCALELCELLVKRGVDLESAFVYRIKDTRHVTPSLREQEENNSATVIPAYTAAELLRLLPTSVTPGYVSDPLSGAIIPDMYFNRIQVQKDTETGRQWGIGYSKLSASSPYLLLHTDENLPNIAGSVLLHLINAKLVDSSTLSFN